MKNNVSCAKTSWYGVSLYGGKMSRFYSFILVLLVLLLSSCSKKQIEEEKPVHSLYQDALKNLQYGNYSEAAKSFQEVETQHPYSNWAAKSQLMAAFCYYMERKYDDSIRVLRGLIGYYPNYKYIDYAYYLLSSNYLQQVPTIDRDVSMAVKARDSFIELSKRFPNSLYKNDAIKNIDLLNNILAAHEMYVGRYYQTVKNDLAALERFKTVINSFSNTGQVSEAYYRVIETCLALGIEEEALRYYNFMLQTTHNSWTDKAKKILNIKN